MISFSFQVTELLYLCQKVNPVTIRKNEAVNYLYPYFFLRFE